MMAVCSQCRQEMTTADTCISKPITRQGKKYAPIPYKFSMPLKWFTDEISHLIEFSSYRAELRQLWQDYKTPEERYAAWKAFIGTRCHDCGVVDGGIHHPGCDAEECPKCGGQIISCDCWSRRKIR